MMIVGSRLGSVQMAQGLRLSIFPQILQISIFSSADWIAAPKGAMICSRFLMRNSATRRAERGPSPGSRASSWIRRSISGPAVVVSINQLFSEQLHSGRQRQPAGNILHFILQQCFGLAPRIRVSRHYQVFHDLLFAGLISESSMLSPFISPLADSRTRTSPPP